MSMGKHDIGAPINEALELHYREEISWRDEKLKTLNEDLGEANREIQRLKFELGMQKAHIEQLEKAFIKTAIEAASK